MMSMARCQCLVSDVGHQKLFDHGLRKKRTRIFRLGSDDLTLTREAIREIMIFFFTSSNIVSILQQEPNRGPSKDCPYPSRLLKIILTTLLRKTFVKRS